MIRKLIPMAVATAVALIGTSALMAKEMFVTIGTGAINGVYYPMGGAIAKIVNAKRKEHHTLICVDSTSGSKHNINSIASGEHDFGIVQADAQYMAYFGMGEWTGKPVSKLRSVFSLAPEAVTFVVTESSGIRSIHDIHGKTICLGDAGSGNRINAEDVCNVFDIVPSRDFRDIKLKQADVPHVLNEGRFDGFFFTVAHPNSNIAEAIAGKIRCRIIPITGVEQLLKSSPYYSMTTIDMSMYPRAANNNEQVQTLGMLSTLVTSEDTPEEVVYTLTKEVMEHIKEFKAMHPALSKMTRERLFDGLTAPLHKGAMKYFKEAGILK